MHPLPIQIMIVHQQRNNNDNVDVDANVIPSPIVHNITNNTTPQIINNLNRYFSSLTPNHVYTSEADAIFNIACLNIKNLRSPAKQQSLLQLYDSFKLQFLGLTETRLTSANTKFLYKDQPNLQAHWAPTPHSYTGGVGFLISKPLSQYLQSTRKWNGRIISADFFLPQFKLRI